MAIYVSFFSKNEHERQLIYQSFFPDSSHHPFKKGIQPHLVELNLLESVKKGALIHAIKITLYLPNS